MKAKPPRGETRRRSPKSAPGLAEIAFPVAATAMTVVGAKRARDDEEEDDD
ncbi:Hypothetical protein A7982_08362 [Minicystis rosea]|nr:Hypothetical protein A7982_08362 [Minicystis rosea]